MGPKHESKQPERRPRLLPVALGLVAGMLLLGGSLLLTAPIEWHEVKLRFQLWSSGARTLEWEKHRGFQADRCGGKSPQECRCIWFVHGMADSSLTWRKVFLEPKPFGDIPVRIFAVDLPGHGGSLHRKNLPEYRASNMATEIDAGIAATPLCERNVLVGNSFGGWVVSLIALQDAKRFEKVFLVSPGGVKKAEEGTKDLFKSGSIEETIASLKEFQKRAYYKPREYPDAFWKKAAERAGSDSVKEVSAAQIEADRLDKKLTSLTVPTTLIWGEADRILPKDVMDVFLAGIHGVKFVKLEKCGHLPQKECPDALFRVIRENL